MPDLVSFVVALVSFVRAFPGVARDAVDGLTNVLCWRLAWAPPVAPKPEHLDDLRARLVALPEPERRLCAYEIARAFAVKGRPAYVAAAWDESAALYLGSGEGCAVSGVASFRPSRLALGVLQADDGQAWASIAVGLVAAAVAERRELSALRGRVLDAGDPCPLLSQWVRDRLLGARPDERGEEALAIVLDVLCEGRADDRARLDRAIVREGARAFWDCVKAAQQRPALEAPRERTIASVRELLVETLRPPYEQHAFLVRETAEAVQTLCTIPRAELVASLEADASDPAQQPENAARMRATIATIRDNPRSIVVLIDGEPRGATELLLVDPVPIDPAHYVNARGGDA